MNKIYKMSGSEQARLIRNKEVSPVEVVKEVFERIHLINPVLNAFCELDEEQAKRSAVEAEDKIMKNEKVGPLHGVPFSVKDLIVTKGVRTAFGSKAYEDFLPVEDDVSVERVREAGAILIGKTIVSEFGYAGSKNMIYGHIKNPWDLNRTPGGSSGGSAVAVATGMGPLTIGSDGGGSIRMPASLTGIYGYKPSFGRVPLYPGCRDPQYPGASSWESLECIGPLTRTVEDSALMLKVMSGPSHLDRHSLPGKPDFVEFAKDKEIAGFKVAWSLDMGFAVLDPEVRKLVNQSISIFERLGCQVYEAHPQLESWNEVFMGLIARDTDFEGMRKLAAKYGEYMEPGLIDFLGRSWTDEQLTGVAMKRQEINIKMRTFMHDYDLFVVPTIGVPAFPIGMNGPSVIDGQPVAPSQWMPFTSLANITGLPAASIPCGWTKDGLPVGLQIIGGHLNDEAVLRASAAFEEANPWIDHLNELMERFQ